MRIALFGTRGVPARYGGFETAVEEVGRRLVERGHEVTVYCRVRRGEGPRPAEYQGMTLVHLPAARRRSLETLSHTALSVLHSSTGPRADAAVVFNAANAVFLPALRARGVPVATHVDGLEWRRGKWGTWGKRYYRMAESLAVRWSDALIADARGIQDYYSAEFGAVTHRIAYGAPILPSPASDRLEPLGLGVRDFHLVVARFEPENHVDLALEGYARSSAKLPLVVVGSAPYASDHVRRIEHLAARTPGVRLLGGVWDQDTLNQLYGNALSYVHGHSVGGTNPSLLRAMGAGTPVVAYDVVFNREVLGEDGWFFASPPDVALALEAAESDVVEAEDRGERLQVRAEVFYDWDTVTSEYEDLCKRLAAGDLSGDGVARPSGRRMGAEGWRPDHSPTDVGPVRG